MHHFVPLPVELLIEAVLLYAGVCAASGTIFSLHTYLFYWYDRRVRDGVHPFSMPDKRARLWAGLKLVIEEAFWTAVFVALRYQAFFDDARSFNRRRDRSKTPVILIHGYTETRGSLWRLRSVVAADPAVGWVYRLNLSPKYEPIARLAMQLSVLVDRVKYETGAARVHIVGHSMGGLVARWYVQKMGGAPNVGAVVTIGTPHGGTPMNVFGPGACAADMMPGSAFLHALDAAPTGIEAGVAWAGLDSQVDNVVFPHEAQNFAGFVARRTLTDVGHDSMVWARRSLTVFAELFAEAVRRHEALVKAPPVTA